MIHDDPGILAPGEVSLGDTRVGKGARGVARATALFVALAGCTSSTSHEAEPTSEATTSAASPSASPQQHQAENQAGSRLPSTVVNRLSAVDISVVRWTGTPAISSHRARLAACDHFVFLCDAKARIDPVLFGERKRPATQRAVLLTFHKAPIPIPGPMILEGAKDSVKGTWYVILDARTGRFLGAAT